MKTKSELVLVKGENLSKEQKAFNAKILAIKTLQEELERLSTNIPKAVEVYNKTIQPYKKEYNKIRKEFIIILDVYGSKVKFTKRDKEILSNYILIEISDLLEENEDLQDLYTKYNGLCHTEQIKMEEEELKIRAADFFKTHFKAEIDMSLSLDEMQEEMHRKLSEGSKDQFAKEKQPKKSKAELNRDKKVKETEEIQRKSIREIYLDLIKVFHPDTEQEPDKKIEKEEISKNITVAYRNNDLFSLIKLETAYLERNSERISKLSEDRLKLYNDMLTKQKKELENDLYRLKYSNEVIYRGMCTKISKPEKFLKKAIEEITIENKVIQSRITDLGNFSQKFKPVLISFMLHELEEIELNLFSSILGY